MGFFTLVLAYSCPAFAAAVAPRGPSTGPYTAVAWNLQDGGISLWGNPINANGGRFWIGKGPATYCPGGVEGLDCSGFNHTATRFTGGVNTLFMDVAVPGGQQGTQSPLWNKGEEDRLLWC